MKTTQNQKNYYEIRVAGHLSEQWVDWFEDMTITPADNGDTLITGSVIDQSALHGLLKKVRDLGLPLVSVNQVQFQESRKNLIRNGEKMNGSEKTKEKMDTKILLSTLWIVVMVNMLMADILSLNIPGAMDELERTAGGTPIPLLMLGGAILMEVSIVMIILSRVLNYGVNRWANIITSIVTIVFVLGGAAAYPHYIFIATVEGICLLLIFWLAWQWRNVEA